MQCKAKQGYYCSIITRIGLKAAGLETNMQTVLQATPYHLQPTTQIDILQPACIFVHHKANFSTKAWNKELLAILNDFNKVNKCMLKDE